MLKIGSWESHAHLMTKLSNSSSGTGISKELCCPLISSSIIAQDTGYTLYLFVNQCSSISISLDFFGAKLDFFTNLLNFESPTNGESSFETLDSEFSQFEGMLFKAGLPSIALKPI